MWLAVTAWALATSLLGARRRRLVLAARARHEIRGPLCAARLALDGLERSARVQAIDLELRRAALALDDLNRGRRPGAFVEPLDVGRMLADCAPAWRALAASHRAAVVIELPRTRALVLADPLRIAQVCANLVANAAEHGGGRVSVRAGRIGRRVRIEVADSGPGLPAPVPVLVAAARGRRTARGHGLAIAASIAQRHGGSLTSAPSGRGARLVLELPAAPARPRPRARAEPPKPGGGTNSSSAGIPSRGSTAAPRPS
jgi:signal transduction histidine kinase